MDECALRLPDALGGTLSASGQPVVKAIPRTRAVVEDNGALTDWYTYDAWGNVIGSHSHVVNDNPFRWNGSVGYRYIAATGLYHAGAREYDPSVGRWLQRDPIGMSGGHPNLYISVPPAEGGWRLLGKRATPLRAQVDSRPTPPHGGMERWNRHASRATIA